MSDIKKKAKDPSSTSMAYDVMVPEWSKMNALLGGTEAMRAAGTEYLPMHPGEKQAAYSERLARNVLTNMTELTLNSWVGRPFSEPVKLSEDMPEDVQDMMEDVDLQGNDITVFARGWFRDGLAKAFSHVLVDFPRVGAPLDGQPRTLEDDRSQKLRPYWVHIPPENVIFAHSRIVNGVEKLMHVRIMEAEVQQLGFTEVAQRQIRVLEPGLVQIYREISEKGRKPTWVLVEEYGTDLDFIPLVTFYADRTGFMTGKSPLLDLADLNIGHWQSQADQTAILTVTRFPILAASGAIEEDAKLEIGPNKWLFNPDPQGKFYYVEHTGAAISAGRQDLEDLKEAMSEYGADFLRKRASGQTATARALDSAESTSPLQDHTRRFIDAIDLAIEYTAAWLSREEGTSGSVELVTEFGPEEADANDLRTLIEARKNKDISRQAFIEELQRRGVINEDYDPDEDDALIEAEAEKAFAAMAKFTDIDPAQGDDDEEDDDKGKPPGNFPPNQNPPPNA